MREIEFRGKEGDGAWVYGDLAASVSVGRAAILEIEVDPETVGQYTGVKDKNGVKIFEGDIVKFTDDFACDKTDQVVWGGEFYPAFDLSNEWFECANSLIELLLDDNAMLEVIGNIHDNPELLNRKGGAE
jgi:uncharacterized phage protein (TIGR01671 family)